MSMRPPAGHPPHLSSTAGAPRDGHARADPAGLLDAVHALAERIASAADQALRDNDLGPLRHIDLEAARDLADAVSLASGGPR